MGRKHTSFGAEIWGLGEWLPSFTLTTNQSVGGTKVEPWTRSWKRKSRLIDKLIEPRV